MDMLDDFSSGDEETTSTENHPEAVDTVLPKMTALWELAL
jgi:putative iron-dependent peroxidase